MSDRKVPLDLDSKEELYRLREGMCSAASNACAGISCHECIFHAPVPEFKEWLTKEIKNGNN